MFDFFNQVGSPFQTGGIQKVRFVIGGEVMFGQSTCGAFLVPLVHKNSFDLFTVCSTYSNLLTLITIL